MISIYNTYIVDNDNEAKLAGEISFEIKSASCDKIEMYISRKVNFGNVHIDEDLLINYSSVYQFENIYAQGRINQEEYILDAVYKNNKLCIRFAKGRAEKVEKYKMKVCLIENNSFIFILSKILKNRRENKFQLYIPHSSQVVTVIVRRIVENEKFDIEDTIILCDRYEMYMEDAPQVKQYCLFSKKDDVLLAMCAENQMLKIRKYKE